MTRDDPAAFAPPPAFGPFRVLHQIGIGALGPVFRTYEPTRDRLVAVKLFRLDITPEQAQALADELARACDAGLFHPSIVEPIAAGVEGTAAYRAEEYVAAESLDVAMRHYAPAPLDKALPFITQLASAIDFARTAGVGHGALHLRDVFVTPDEARASGFGIVESLEHVGIRAPVRRPYSAPERIAGAAWSTPADVFSLAAIAYELLTARRPAGTGDQIGPLAGAHVGEHAGAVRAVLARAMDDDPARRYSSAVAFASALEVAARGGAVADAVITVGAIGGGEDGGAKDDGGAKAPPYTDVIKPEPQLESVVEAPEPIEVPPVPVEEPVEEPVIEEEEAQPAATSFDADEEEPLAHLDFDEAPIHAEPPRWQYESHEEPAAMGPSLIREDATEPERARLAMLPVAFGLVFGLLIGFAGGYMLAIRSNSSVPQTTAATKAPAPATPPQPAASQPQRSGQAWSEQAVAQPSAPPPSPATPPRSSNLPPVPGDEPAATRPATHATTGQVTINSTPSGAAVTLNGKWRGRTPLTIDDLAFGTYTLRVVQPGFAVAREEVTLSGAHPSRTLSFKLQRPGAATAAAPSRGPAAASEKSAGSIFVASRPAGARIFLDGRPVGTTPATIPNVATGSHVVRLELADHRIWTASTRVAAGQETRVTGSLERIQ